MNQKQMYEDRINFLSWEKIARKNNCSIWKVHLEIDQYIEKNNLPSVEEAQGEMFYFKVLEGKSVRKLSTEYGITRETIAQRISYYASQNELMSPKEEQAMDMYNECIHKYLTYKDLAVKYGISEKTIKNHIDALCLKKGLLPIREAMAHNMYQDRVNFMSQNEVSHKYECTSEMVKILLSSYISENNLPSIKEARGKLLYDALLSSGSISYLEEKFQIDSRKIRKILLYYLEDTGLVLKKIPNKLKDKHKKALNISDSEIYDKLNEGYSLRSIAEKLSVSHETVRSRQKKESQRRLVNALDAVVKQKVKQK